MSSSVQYPMATGPLACTKPSIFPLFHDSWLATQSCPGRAWSWQVDGIWNARMSLVALCGLASIG